MRGIFLGIVVSIACVPSSYAGLVFEGVALASSGGFGSNNVVLAAENHGSERGCVEWSAAADYGSIACEPGTALDSGVPDPPGTGETGTPARPQTVEQSAGLTANQIRFVFNANADSNENSPIQIDDLVVDFFDPNGNLAWGSFQTIMQPAWAPAIYNGRSQQPAPPGSCSICAVYMKEPLRPSPFIDFTP